MKLRSCITASYYGINVCWNPTLTKDKVILQYISGGKPYLMLLCEDELDLNLPLTMLKFWY